MRARPPASWVSISYYHGTGLHFWMRIWCKVLLCICSCMRVDEPQSLSSFGQKIFTVTVTDFWRGQQVCNGLSYTCCLLLHLLISLKWYIYFPQNQLARPKILIDLWVGGVLPHTHQRMHIFFGNAFTVKVSAGCRFCPFSHKWG